MPRSTECYYLKQRNKDFVKKRVIKVILKTNEFCIVQNSFENSNLIKANGSAFKAVFCLFSTGPYLRLIQGLD